MPQYTITVSKSDGTEKYVEYVRMAGDSVEHVGMSHHGHDTYAMDYVQAKKVARFLQQRGWIVRVHEVASLRPRLNPKLTLKTVREALRLVGVTVKHNEYGEYEVRKKGTSTDAIYFASDLEDALGTGRRMAEAIPNPKSERAALRRRAITRVRRKRVTELRNMPTKRSRKNPPLVVFGNPPKFTRQDFQLLAEIIGTAPLHEQDVLDLARHFVTHLTSTNANFRSDVFYRAVGEAYQRAHGKVKRNPPRFRDLALSVDMCEIRYKHAQDGKYYKHKFKPKQVQIWTHPNSKTATLKRVDGKPLIGEY